MFDEERAVLQRSVQQFQDKVAELEAENQKLKEANRWIPVSERLPEETGNYLVTYRVSQGCVTYVHYFKNTRWLSLTHNQVIAWKKLPEPYQEDV